MNDDAVRRQLRFSLFLQGFAALMMGGAAVIRIIAFGFDIMTAVLIVLVAVILVAMWFTRARMRAM